jgi:hypothetical protein
MRFIPALIMAVVLFSENGVLAQEPEAAPQATAAQEDDPMPLPALRDPIKVRTIKHPIGTQFAYPYGREWGRVFPEGTVVAAPGWIVPMPTTPTTLVQPQLSRTR